MKRDNGKTGPQSVKAIGLLVKKLKHDAIRQWEGRWVFGRGVVRIYLNVFGVKLALEEVDGRISGETVPTFSEGDEGKTVVSGGIKNFEKATS